jgi:aspartate carbamoyltransferase catalytic subunit
MRHLLSIDDLSRADIEGILDLSERFHEVMQRDRPKVPALRGKTITSLFYEDSTRTRLSFETAAKRLSADVMTFSVSTSSVQKGESLFDTVRTIEAMGTHAFVVRHRAAGAPHRVASWTTAAVVNAGDGRHEHPTQALLDAFTLRRHRGPSLDGARIAIVGDIRNSRVARSGIKAWTKLGAHVTLVGPPTLMPESFPVRTVAHPDGGKPSELGRVTVAHDADDALADVDVVYLLRIQRERAADALFPSVREYHDRYGLTRERFAALKPDTLVMHPGPMNRGVEIAPEVADSDRSLVTEQVANGVPVRMAVLYTLLGTGGPV